MYLDDEVQIELIKKLFEEKDFFTCSEIIELKYVYDNILNGYISMKDEIQVSHIDIIKKIQETSGKFFAGIDNSNIVSIYDSLEKQCVYGFWILFEKYKLYDSINPGIFDCLIKKDVGSIYYIIFLEKTVLKYGKIIKKYLIDYIDVFETIIDYFFGEKSDRKKEIFLPKELTKDEKLDILEKYIEWDNNNPNYLTLLLNSSRSNTEYPINNDIKLKAQKRIDEFWKKHFEENTGHFFEVEVSFREQKEEKVESYKEGKCKYNYSSKWIKNNLDYPTLCNNLIYLFDLVDSYYVSTAYSKKLEMGLFESIGLKGASWYNKGIAFDVMQLAIALKLQAYEIELKKNNISLDSLFKWFYETYLNEEFGINDFHYQSISEGNSDIEKCILISCGIENVLKQFQTYCEKREINRDYFEIKTDPILFENVDSLVDNKYAYISRNENGKLLRNEMSLLFGESGVLSYCKKIKACNKSYKNIVEMLSKEKITISDFNKQQMEYIKFLMNRGTIIEKHNGLKVNFSRAYLLKLLYQNESLSLSYLNKFSFIINQWIADGEIETESSLFTRQEQDYLSYLLNNRKYDNGLCLRNRYAWDLSSR